MEEAPAGLSSHAHDADPMALGPESYTAHRLQHATPEHLNLTTRRCFIGPIPEGWLKSHRKAWYKHHLHINYSSRAATFHAAENVSHQRHVTGLDGPSALMKLGQSFPQPDDVDEEEDDQDDIDADEEADATTETPTAIAVPRSLEPDAMPEVEGAIDDNQGPSPTPLEPRPSGRRSISIPKHRSKAKKSRKKRAQSSPKSHTGSFVTARETFGSPEAPGVGASVTKLNDEDDAPASMNPVQILSNNVLPLRALTLGDCIDSGRSSWINGELSTPAEAASNSMASLLHHDDDRAQHKPGPKGILSKVTGKQSASALDDGNDDQGGAKQTSSEPQRKAAAVSSGLVRFNIPEEAAHNDRQVKIRMDQLGKRRSLKHAYRRGRKHEGEIMKMEKMLVRVDSTMQELPNEYDENDSVKIESRAVEKWREFMVVCRESTDEGAEFSLQLYKTRVIPAKEQTHVVRRSKHEIPLSRKTTKVNLFSSLDKTLVIWVPWKLGTMIYTMRPRSAANSVEWYTFLRSALGWHRPTNLQINVPDFKISLRLENPFEMVEAARDEAHATDGADDAIERTMAEEQAAAENVIKRCLKMLRESHEWDDVLDTWAKNGKVGLAWKRYDRLEWVHGANEQKMYGTIAMQKSHELELRPKKHYPTETEEVDGNRFMEPPPVEGFLVRLTSQRGRDQRLGKLFFKRLYFTTHNQFLCFSKPAKALPPPPPKLPMSDGSKIPTAGQIADKIPLIYAVKPYMTEDGDIIWMKSRDVEERKRHDQDAYDEAERKVNTLIECDGYINLCNVAKVRHVVRGSTPADQNIDQGPAVDFNEDVSDTHRDDGATKQFDDHRTFELLMENRLVVRLQAYDVVTKKEWMNRLQKLVRYWKLRVSADVEMYKMVRRANLEALNISEEVESYLGQFGRKWETTRSVASAELYNMCGISCCRTISMSGVLYQKPRRHSTFKRCGVILCHGHLLTFQDALRKRTGEEVPHIHHDRTSVIDLKDCYIYSGLVTEGDLLYQNQTFDSSNPGHHALPRVYLDDGWTSTDEDTMTCFVIWQVKKKSMFKGTEEKTPGKVQQRLKRVSQLGVPGRSIVFMTRSRAERDHWVMSIGVEIERLQQAEEVRVVTKD
ncbi:MAG: hypothetical protein M1827_001890 [Pycnora praestabilis]|nr:MAG: hypothetical protein M1827_001890 [Pycnora praestabilis]